MCQIRNMSPICSEIGVRSAEWPPSAIAAHLLPAFGSLAVEDVSTEAIERWIVGYEGSVRSRNKLLIEIHGILGRAKKVHALRENAAAEVEKFQAPRSGDIDVFTNPPPRARRSVRHDG
jgi:hypothetical protein